MIRRKPKRLRLPVLKVLVFLFLAAWGGVRANGVLQGQVVRIIDGDSLEIKTSSGDTLTIRLQGIDAPEPGQPFNNKARSVLSEMVFGRVVEVVIEGKDQYERLLGQVYLGETWINRAMVREGMAWHYRYFSRDPLLAHSEIFARYSRLGIWSEPDPQAPWMFRHEKRAEGGQQPDRSYGDYWLNTSTGVRHNKSCKYFMNTRRGRFCGPDDGRPCGECGG